MSTQVGRISGALLKDNLLRDGLDLAFETDLLYLDVNNNKIGIKTSSPTRDLLIETEVQTTNLIVDTLATIDAMITLDNTSRIATFLDDLNIIPAGPSPQVISTHLGVGDFDIDGIAITQTASNADIDIRPSGTGIFKVVNDLFIDGSLHVTGNVTLDGNIIFGDQPTDSVTFAADVDSDIIPDPDITYNLGDGTKKWKNLWSGYLNGEVVDVATLEVGPIDPSRRQGNIWYVAVNGRSDFVGDHPNGPFESIERALNHAVSGDTVYVYPGIYYELFPLTVPAGVTVTGADIRNTIVVPDTASEFEDVFLLNDETTIQNLTIKNFYFDSINNKGYAFRFAPNIQVTNRSPYIQNISVITRGTVTSPSDPLGFLTGDAGKGAYIDGSVANSATNEAAMLFNSATFITPGVDAITMINGVRVEWLDSFTYYANRGLYALQGASGLASLGLQYGAEIRSINSADIYGNYGAVADGADTLMYLISHNFAYIGTGYDTSNDPTLVIQANETVELNSGKIHYVSFDHAGTFRVGDTFWVDLKKGTTSFDISSITANDLVGIKLIDGDQVTYIDYSKIETGNIQIAGNTIQSTVGPLNITSASNEINLDQDVFITKNLAVSNNVTIAGQLNLGNAITDVVRFDAEIDDNLDPKANVTYNIGSPTRNWKDLYTRRAEVSDIEIFTNYIRTLYSNEDLELRANGTGSILIEDIRVNQNVISTDSNNIQINPATTLDITASITNVNGIVYITNDLSIDSDFTIGTDASDTIAFKASINSSIEPQLDQTYSLGDNQRSWNLYAASMLLDDIEINDNYIRTTASNLDLEFRAAGTGSVQFENTYFDDNRLYTIGTNLLIQPATTLDITGNTIQNGILYVSNDLVLDSDFTIGNSNSDIIRFVASVNTDIVPQYTSKWDLGDNSRAWNLYASKILLDEIEINDNYIITTISNSNLELKASGTGAVLFEKTYFNENVISTVGTNLRIEPATTLDITSSTSNINGILHVTNNVLVDSDTTFGNSSSDIITFSSYVNTNIVPQLDSTWNLGDTARAWNLYTDLLLLDDIEINDNYIRTTASNLNLELKANGTGSVLFEKTFIDANRFYTVSTNLKIEPATTLDITSSQTTTNGNLIVSQNVVIDSNTTFGDTSSDTHTFNARVNTDIIPDVDSTRNLGDTLRAWNLYTDMILLDDVEINDNYIRTTASNLNLELKANGTGAVRFERVDFNENIIRTNGTTNLELRPATTLDIYATTSTVNGDLSVTGNFNFDGTITIGNQSTDTISFVADLDSDLIPDVDNTYNIGSLSRRWDILWASNALIGNIEVNTNYITTTSGNLDLTLQGNSSGGILTEDLRFRSNVLESKVTNQNIQISLTGTSILDMNTNTSLRVARGSTADRPTANMLFGDIRFNTTDSLFGGFTTARTTFGGVYSADRLTYARATPTTNIINFITQSTTAAYVDTTKLWLNGLTVDSFNVQNNVWSTNNIDLIFDPDLNNPVEVDDIRFDDNNITNLSNSNISLANTGAGYVKFEGSQGIKIPAGDNSQRPGPTPPQGSTRWSTENDYLEIFIGTSWQISTSSGSGFASIAEIKEAADLYTLILG
jgi:hypothetical protein